jgi:hypothetical protein
MGNSKSDDWDSSAFNPKERSALTSSIKVDPLLSAGAVLSFARNRETLKISLPPISTK